MFQMILLVLLSDQDENGSFRFADLVSFFPFVPTMEYVHQYLTDRFQNSFSANWCARLFVYWDGWNKYFVKKKSFSLLFGDGISQFRCFFKKFNHL